MDILGMLTQQLGGSMMDQLGQQIGGDTAGTSKAVAAALPMLVGALARNAAKPEGATALANALDNDHDGGLLDNLGGFLGGGGNVDDGNGILKHMLGGKRGPIEAALGQSSGLSAGAIGKLLPMLAPILMGALGQAKRTQGLDAGGLASMLGGASRQAEASMPQLGGLARMLGADGDGDVKDDLLGIGARILGRLFGRR